MVRINSNPTATTTKFLCSYGGRILPRHPDGKLRYHGGVTRVLSVHRSVSFAELMVKLGEFCGTSVSLRCQLPTEDLDALVSITSDEDLANLIEEYDRAASPPSTLKIRAFLSPPKSTKQISPPPSTASSSSYSAAEIGSAWRPPPAKSTYSAAAIGSASRYPTAGRCVRRISAKAAFPLCYEKSAGKLPHCAHRGIPNHIYLVHNGNHWQ
ncbi:uncharacterized protein LOC132276316 [Cornus florida]|uniref:uncharacterized protein LOC132276316 n=1 Tax=Cornus florida TaxID=4283 RepID=UPI00289C9196|nr:uncharacterized protein LOC132276316 [Cornus florida]